jgi:hypothetical protein
MSAQEGPSPTEKLFGAEVPVSFEGKADAESVTLREIPVAEWPKAIAAEGNEFALVDLFAGRPSGWSLTLKPESFGRIIAEGERLNAGFFAYCDRTERKAIARLRRVAPEKLEEMVNGIMSPSPTGLPTSALPRR